MACFFELRGALRCLGVRDHFLICKGWTRRSECAEER